VDSFHTKITKFTGKQHLILAADIKGLAILNSSDLITNTIIVEENVEN
jgi:hypothetical protein